MSDFNNIITALEETKELFYAINRSAQWHLVEVPANLINTFHQLHLADDICDAYESGIVDEDKDVAEDIDSLVFSGNERIDNLIEDIHNLRNHANEQNLY